MHRFLNMVQKAYDDNGSSFIPSTLLSPFSGGNHCEGP